ncbi:MAG: hypothetical protein ACRCXZ_04650, partial [Patescibacteria group bacterium]
LNISYNLCMNLEQRKAQSNEIELKRKRTIENFADPELSIKEVPKARERLVRFVKLSTLRIYKQLLSKYELSPDDCSVLMSGGLHLGMLTLSSDLDIDLVCLNEEKAESIKLLERELFLSLVTFGLSVDPFIVKEFGEGASTFYERAAVGLGELYKTGEINDDSKTLPVVLDAISDSSRGIEDIKSSIMNISPLLKVDRVLFFGCQALVPNEEVEKMQGEIEDYFAAAFEISEEYFEYCGSHINDLINGDASSINESRIKSLISRTLIIIKTIYSKSNGKFPDSFEDILSFTRKELGEEFTVTLSKLIDYNYLRSNYLVVGGFDRTQQYLRNDEFNLQVANACGFESNKELGEFLQYQFRIISDGIAKLSKIA